MITWQYTLIILLPFVATLVVTQLATVYLRSKYPKYITKLVLLAFSGILKTEKKAHGEVYIFDDIELTDINIQRADVEGTPDEFIRKIINVMFAVVFMIWIPTMAIFWQMLLLDLSYTCTDGDLTKDCFEFHNIKAGFKEYFAQFSAPPLDCSTLSDNTTTPIVCYRLVFNLGFATGVSYGTFKVMTVVLNLLTMAMLLPKSRSKVWKLQCVIFLAVVAAFAVAIGVMYGVDIPQIKLQNQQTAQVLQIMFSIMVAVYVVFLWPWQELVDIKTTSQELEEAGVGGGHVNAGANVPI